MRDPELAYTNQPCACRFTRDEDFGPSRPVEWCGFHATMRARVQALLDALDPQEPLYAAYGLRAINAYNGLRTLLDESKQPTNQNCSPAEGS